MRTRSVPSRSLPFRLSPIAASIALSCTPAFALTVTNTGDNGGIDPSPGANTGTLRQAIVDANAACATVPAPTIDFAITGTGPFTISPASQLPQFFCPSNAYSPTVDATTQFGQIAINGSTASAGGGVRGLQIADSLGGNGVLTVKGIDIHGFSNAFYGGGIGVFGRVKVYSSRITGNDTGIQVVISGEIGDISDATKGNLIANNPGNGIYLQGGAVVANNFIGTLDGSTSAPNGIGINVAGEPVTISKNIISGNSGDGILVQADRVSISTNLIGTNSSGTSALGNGSYGIFVSFGSSITISGNTLSGNLHGSEIWGADSSVVVSGNKIGTNTAGTAAIGNEYGGLDFQCSSGASVTSNVISGNGNYGVAIFGSDLITLSGNKIGVAADGSTALGNAGYGVLFYNSECSNPSDNVLSGNTIAANSLPGVEFLTGSGNKATQNRIYQNGFVNIDIEANYSYGALPNDSLDVDTGANFRQNYPENIVVTQAPGGTSTTITFTLDTTPGTYTIEAFQNPGAGIGAGRTYIGSTTLTSPGTGPVAGSLTISGAHDFISLTATSSSGDTSEFSSPIVAGAFTPAPAPLQAQLSAPSSIDLGAYAVGDPPLSRTVVISNTGTGVLTFSSIAITGPFTMSNDCPPNLSPARTCNVVLGFSAELPGAAVGSLNIASNAAGGSRSIPVTALAQAQAAPVIKVTPTLLAFGSRMVGTSSPSQPVTITNIGGVDATLGALEISIEYLVSSTCGATLTPGSSCFADVTFKPLGFGLRPGTLTIRGNDVGSPHVVNLDGIGCRPFMVGRNSQESCAP